MKRLVLALAAWLTSIECMAQMECTAQFGDPRVDLGAIRRPLGARALDPVRLPVRTATLIVSCSREAVMTLAFSAREAAPVFALGHGGHLQVRISETLLDGRTVQLHALHGAAASGARPLAVDRVKPGDVVQPAVEGAAAGGTVLQLRLELAAVLMPGQWRINDLHDLEAVLRVQVSAL